MDNFEEKPPKERLILLIEFKDLYRKIISFENFVLGGLHPIVKEHEKVLRKVKKMIKELKLQLKEENE